MALRGATETAGPEDASGGGQELAVHLAVRGAGEGRQRDPGAGHHERRQSPGEEGPQGFGGLGGRHVGDQPEISRPRLEGGDQGLPHPRVARQERLDLAGLDPEPAHLDLVVDAAQELELAVHQPDAHPVARAIETVPARRRAERIGHEALGGQPGPAEVAARQAGAPQVELAGSAGRHRLHPGVQHAGLRARHRPADRHRPAGAHRHQRPGRIGRVLGRTIEIEDAFDGAGAVSLLHQRAAQRLSGQVDRPHRRRERSQVEQLRQRRRHGVQQRGLPVRHGRERQGIVHQQDRAAAGQRDEQLEDGEVEAHRRGGHRARQGFGREGFQGPPDHRHGAAVLDGHTLGPAGRARRINEVGQARREVARRLRLRAPVQSIQGIQSIQEKSALGTEIRTEPGPGDQHPCPGVLHQPALALPRVGGVDRYVGAARLEHRQQRRGQRDPPVQADRHRLLGRDPQGGQVAGQAGGLGEQLAVGGALLGVHHGHGVGRALGLDLDEAVERGAVVPHFPCAARIGEHLEKVRLAPEGQGRERPHRIGGRPLQEVQEVPEQPFQGGALEEPAVPAHGEPHLVPHLGRDQLQVEAHRPALQLHRFRPQTGQIGRGPRRAQGEGAQVQGGAGRRALEDEQGLKQGRTAGVALRLQPLDQHGERHLPVLVGGEGRTAHRAEQGLERGISRQAGPHHHRVDQVAHQAGQLRPVAAIGGHPDQQVVLSGIAVQEGQEPGHQGGRERGALAAGQSAEAAGGLRIQAGGERAAAVARSGGARPVGQQRGLRQLAGQALPPEFPEPLSLVSGEAPRLPADVVGVAQPRRRRDLGRAAAQRPVGRVQIALEHRQRPEVGDDVMHGDEQDVFLRAAAEDRQAQQRILLQVERAPGLLVQPLAQLVFVPGRGVLLPDRGTAPPVEAPHRAVLPRMERAAQRGVAPGDQGGGLFQDVRLQGAVDPQRRRDVVGRARRIEPLEEPERLLAVGQRLFSLFLTRAFDAAFRALPGGDGGADPVRHLGEERPFQERGQGDGHAEALVDAVAQLHRAQGVETQGGDRLRGVHRGQGEAGELRHLAAQEGEGLARGIKPGCRRVRRQGGDQVQIPLQQQSAAEPALDLAAGGLGDRAGLDQGHRVDRGFMSLGYRPADGRGQLPGIALEAAVDLQDHRQPLLVVRVDREGGGAARAQRRVAPLGRQLHVLGIEIAPAQDDQILQPAGDEQFPLEQETEVAGAQERPLGAAVRPGLELLPRELRLPPVPARHAGAGHPDLSDLPLGDDAGRLRIDDQHLLTHPGRAATHQLAAVEPRHRRRPPRRAAGDEQRRLGQAIAGVERLAPEAARREHVREALLRLGAHRLGAVERHRPGTQIEPLPLLGTDLAGAQLIGEVGAAAGRAVEARDRLQPDERLLQERHRRHQHARRAHGQRLEHVADQPHVVVERQPPHHHGVAAHAESLPDHLLVVEEVAVRDHHPLGGGCRAGGVLEERQAPAVDPRLTPGAGRVRGIDFVGRQAAQGRQLRHLGPRRVQAPQQGRRGQGDGRPRIPDDRHQPWKRPAGLRRIGRHRHRTGVDTTEEGGDEVEPWRVEQQHRIARPHMLLEPGRDAARPLVEPGEGEPLLGPPVGEKGVTVFGRHIGGAITKELDKIVDLTHRA